MTRPLTPKHLATLGLLIWLGVQGDKENTAKRLAIYGAFTAMQGLMLADFAAVITYIDRSIPLTALLGTTAVFACFAAFALLSRRRSMLYLGGVLSSGLTILVLLGFLRSFFSFGVSSLELYGGLALFVGYVVFDTQLVVEKADAGSTDFVWHATTLYLDFINIAIRIAIVLARNKEDNDRRKARRDSAART